VTTADLLAILYPNPAQRDLTPEQKAIARHPKGPAWVLAGPGSGKTEVLSVMVLRLLYVDNDPVQAHRVPPESILVTTFTDKAARNLEDRILNYRARLVAADSSLASIDVSKLRVDTLHGLANDLLQEFRAPNYQNVRLMDEFEQALFVREHMSLIKTSNPPNEISFWRKFAWLFTPLKWQPTRAYPPSRWNSTHALVALLNRIVEDRVSVAGLRAAGGQLARLADLYDEYVQHLQNNYRCDFSQLQKRFLDFLGTPLGQAFMLGGDSAANPGIQWVLVDEYQDTNPIQEEIYFRLAARSPSNLIVVGDDDQAMYRFRGGSVECMVTFDQACNAFLGIAPASVSRYSLVDNFRSHSSIVSLFNDFITAFPLMGTAGARSPKPAIVARKTIASVYPAVGRIVGTTKADLAQQFAQTVADLIGTGKVNDPNECCLLLKSTKESPNNAGPFVSALGGLGLFVYNPRNKTFMEQEEVQGLLGAILAIVDPSRRYALDPANTNSIPDAEADFRAAYDSMAASNPSLDTYVANCQAAILARPGQPFDCNLQELAYYLMSCEPFSTWQKDPARRIRLAKLTKLLEGYNSTPVLDPATGLPRPNVTRGFIRGSKDFPGEALGAWLHSFYHLFLTYVVDAGMNDDEDDEVICPPGMVPIMTMHQSKGLEFPFVFVGHMGEGTRIGPSHFLETLFSGYPANPARSFPRRPEAERAEMDMIRQYYVAYSRAEYALIFLGTTNQFNKASVPCGPTAGWLKHKTNPL
jgi:DNA helicase II / ATP-dependent DNA helicase PcrA